MKIDVWGFLLAQRFSYFICVKRLKMARMPVINSSPAVQTSKKEIKYIESNWKVHRFSILCGDFTADVEVLKMGGSLLIWIGSPGRNEFNELALGVPSVYKDNLPVSTVLLGSIHNTESSSLATKISSKLQKPVYISCNITTDRLTAPVLEKGLLLQMKNHPDNF